MPIVRRAALVACVIVGAIAACRAFDEDATVVPPLIDAAGSEDVVAVDAGPQRAEFGLDVRPSNVTCKAPARPPANAPVKFERVYANLDLPEPIVAVQRPGDASRWYVVSRLGRVLYFPSQSPTTTTQAVNFNYALGPAIAGSPGIYAAGEGGLLGFAFHPKFAANGKAYVSFLTFPRASPTEPSSSSQSVIAELVSTDGGATFTTMKTILAFDQTVAGNHKGGGLVFGTDGYLYASFGDGGSGSDAFAKGQKKDGFFARVIRIDVDVPDPGRAYGIPSDNPFKNGGGEPATFARGFRNPFRISIDRDTGDLWAADVGEQSWEEIDHVKLGGNYGWPCREGTHPFLETNALHCPDKTNILDPVFEYPRPATGGSITGGFVYRGKAIPSFVGTYVFGDYVTQKLYGLTFDAATGAPKSTHLNEQGPVAGWAGFGEDENGEIYPLALFENQMFKLVPAPGAQPDTFPDLLSKTGCVDPTNPKKPAQGLLPYAVNAQLWSDGADKERFVALPDGKTITVNGDGDFDLPIGSVVVKSFKLDGRFVETRLLVRHDDGGWAGYTYEWSDDQSDALLLRGSKAKTVGARRWYFPSRGECARCHTDAAGKTLGLELGQLNGDFVYTSTNRISNQLKTLDHVGMFAAPLGKAPSELPLIPAPDGSAAADQRARAYLHANCAQCHRPGGGGRGKLDLRFSTQLRDTASCNVDGEAGDLGIAGAKLLLPGDPTRSLVARRPRATDARRMPPLATSVVDTQGLGVVDAWITSLTGCP